MQMQYVLHIVWEIDFPVMYYMRETVRNRLKQEGLLDGWMHPLCWDPELFMNLNLKSVFWVFWRSFHTQIVFWSQACFGFMLHPKFILAGPKAAHPTSDANTNHNLLK